MAFMVSPFVLVLLVMPLSYANRHIGAIGNTKDFQAVLLCAVGCITRWQAVDVRQGQPKKESTLSNGKNTFQHGGNGSEYLLRRLAWPACGRWCLRRVLATLNGLYAHWHTMRAFGGERPIRAGDANCGRPTLPCAGRSGAKMNTSWPALAGRW